MKAKLHNFIEDLVWEHLDQELKLWKDLEITERNKLDIATYALNHIKPRYFDTDVGYSHTIHDSRNGEQLIADVILAITAGIRVVVDNPRSDRLTQFIDYEPDNKSSGSEKHD